MSDVSQYWIDELACEVEPWEIAELNDSVARRDAFSGDLRFGTGGIRCLMGIGTNRMNRLTIAKATQGLADWLFSSVGLGASVAVG